MSNLPISEEELLHAEIETLKVSVVMLKISERGKVANRILVHKNDIGQFKQLGYAELVKEEYNPQIGHLIEPEHIHLPEEHINFIAGLREEKELLKQKMIEKLSFGEKIMYYIKKLFKGEKR